MQELVLYPREAQHKAGAQAKTYTGKAENGARRQESEGTGEEERLKRNAH